MRQIEFLRRTAIFLLDECRAVRHSPFMTRPALTETQARLLSLLATAPAHLRFGRKVWLAACGTSVEDTADLLAMHAAGAVTLTRCDLVPAFDRDLVRLSEVTRDLGFTQAHYHFAELPAA